MFYRRRNKGTTNTPPALLVTVLLLVLILSAAAGCSGQSADTPADEANGPAPARGEGDPPQPPPDGARKGPPGGFMGGQVVSIDENVMSITSVQGELSVRTSADTIFTIDGADGGLSDIQPDMFVRITGETGDDEGVIDATQVDASTEPPMNPRDRQDQ